MVLRGFENIKIVPRPESASSKRKLHSANHTAPSHKKSRASVAHDSSKGTILKAPPPKKLHFLDRTDPHFKKDLATSVKHVEYVVGQLNQHVPTCTAQRDGALTNVKFVQLETVCRETVNKRRAHSDNGDVEVTWTSGGVNYKAILEVKQRKSPKFTCKADFPYDTVITDEKRLFDKIRARGDTIGYLVTNHDKSVFMFVSHARAEATYTTHTSMDRWKNRVRTFVDVPLGEFVEGTEQCAHTIFDTLLEFGPRSDNDQNAIMIKMTTEKLEGLRAKLHEAHKTSEKTRREIDLEEAALVKLNALCK